MAIMRGAKVFPMLLAFVLAGGGTLAAGPTPVPGGANQHAGVSGTMNQVLFNGKLRLQNMSLRDARPTDSVRPSAAQRGIVFSVDVSNGTKRADHGYFDAKLSDANGITVEGRPLDSGWDLQQAEKARSTYGFIIAPDFVPTKLVLTQAATPNAKAFRITVRPSDLAPAPAPAASP